jgi:hypothetical protein
MIIEINSENSRTNWIKRKNIINSTIEPKISTRCDELDSLISVMTTSGTTSRSGEGKLVFIPEDCVVPNISDFIQLWKINQTSRIGLLSPATFDPSIIQIFCSLTAGTFFFNLTFTLGATLLCPRCQLRSNPRLYAEFLIRNGITVLHGRLHISFLATYYNI